MTAIHSSQQLALDPCCLDLWGLPMTAAFCQSSRGVRGSLTATERDLVEHSCCSVFLLILGRGSTPLTNCLRAHDTSVVCWHHQMNF